MKQRWKRIFCILLSFVVLVSCAAPEGSRQQKASSQKQPQGEESFTYSDFVSQLCTNWNPHTYMTQDDAYPQGFIQSSLYGFYFNDKLHPVKGKKPYESYVIVPEMAAGEPEDVTVSVRASHPQFNIPASAAKGFAFRVRLREDLCWEDGTPITADTYIKSLKRLLDPRLLNYRAADVYNGTYSIANSEKYANAGKGVFMSFASMGTTYEDYIKGGGKDGDVYVDISSFWNIKTADNKPYGAITDDKKIRDKAVKKGEKEDYVSPKYLWKTYLSTGAVDGAENYVGIVENKYPADYSFDNVGLYKEDDHTLVFAFNNALEGYYLAAGLSAHWLVKPELYDACLKETKTASGSVWSSTYNTNKKTTVSYGPYKLDSYQRDKAIRFVRNEKWFGYHDGNHVYIDPEDGKQYDMYQTTAINCQMIADATTAKQMFFAGKISEYSLQAEDYEQYRNSEFCHEVPAGSTYFIILNGFDKVIKKREEAPDFNRKTTDLETITLEPFRRAFAVSFDKSDFVNNQFPSFSEGFGLIGSCYIYDPDRCTFYRDTKQAKKTLCDFYGVDPKKYSSLETAEGSITGYDPVEGTKLFEEAYQQALKKGYLTDKNHNGKADQKVTISYSIASDSDQMTRRVDYMNDCLKKATAGTGLEGRVVIEKSAPLGNDWAVQFQNGLTDLVIAGWSGSQMDPFGLTELYAKSDKAYTGNWFDATREDMTVKLDGKEITMSLADWSDSLNGKTVTVGNKDYNFGFGNTTVKNRLKILASFEKAILSTNDYVPLAEGGSMTLLSQKMYYVTDVYNPVMGYGDLSYIRYNYNDREWNAYLRSQKGILQY